MGVASLQSPCNLLFQKSWPSLLAFTAKELGAQQPHL